MDAIGASEAPTHFSEILERVERGERVAVMREGRHVATIIPAEAEQVSSEKAVERILARRERIRLDGRGLSLKAILETRDEGRK